MFPGDQLHSKYAFGIGVSIFSKISLFQLIGSLQGTGRFLSWKSGQPTEMDLGSRNMQRGDFD